MNTRILDINSGYQYFIFARIVGIFFKPVLLFLLISFDFKEIAEIFSKIIIISLTVYSFLHFPFHFHFYKRFFSGKSSLLGLYKYLRDFSIFVLIIFPIIFVITLFFFDSLIFAILTTFWLVSEKILDEIQRYEQYCKQFLEWSVVFLLKIFVPAILLVGFLFIYQEIALIVFLFSSILTNSLLIFFLTRKKDIPHPNIFVNVKNVKKIINRVFFSERSLYVVIILFAFLPNIDRFLAGFDMYKNIDLASLTLLGQIGNGICLVISFFYISNKRSFYISPSLSLKHLFSNGKVFGISFLFTVSMIFVINILLTSGFLDLSYSIGFICLYLFGFMMISLDQIFTENQYWIIRPNFLIIVDLFAFAIFFALSNLLAYSFFSAIFLLTFTFRFICHLYLHANQKRFNQ